MNGCTFGRHDWGQAYKDKEQVFSRYWPDGLTADFEVFYRICNRCGKRQEWNGKTAIKVGRV